jgi:hypothetical protein
LDHTTVAVAAATAGSLLCSAAHADDPQPDPGQVDRKALGGYGTVLNFRGVSHELETDTTVSTATDRDPVEAVRVGARFLVLPAPFQSTTWWGLSAGVRTGLMHFDKSANPSDPTWNGMVMSNIEPALGAVFESAADQLRFEIDLAPAISLGVSSRLASQAALAAALATAPHDDLLFLPNLHSAGRLRVSLARRWDFHPLVSLGLRAEVETGYAQTESAYGLAQGTAGGAEIRAKIFVRTRQPALEGIYIEAFADVGYTSAWSSDVVLPLRAGGGFGVALSRTVEVWLVGSRFTSSIVLAGLDSSGATAGVRWSFDRSPPEWTKRHVDMQPSLAGPEMQR